MPSTRRLSASQRRAALEQLGRDRLIILTNHFGLEVGDKRVVANHVSALLRARSVDFSELLGLLTRQELQSICEALGLDRGGREKELLVQRILSAGEGGQGELPLDEPAREEESAEKPKAGRAKAPKNGGDLGFEATLWQAADKLRNNMDAAEYKHVVLGLIFLKYISDAFEERHAQLLAEVDQGADPEHPDEYRAENIFWVPKEARWSRLQAQAKQPTIGKLIDDAMVAIERDNPSLKGVLPKEYARPGLDKQRLGELIDLIGTIGLGDREHRSKDILGRVYEYFLSEFASAEGKKGGQFYTPQSVVKLLVEMLAPYRGRVFDPCCGSGGMFVQSEKFVEAHGGKLGDISIFGQESNPTTWKLAKMNLAIRGIDANLGSENADSFHRDLHKDLKADNILANPPFNDSDWGGDRLREDVRWKYGVPPTGNANFAWVQHFIHHLAPTGTAGFVLANGSMSSNQSGEGEIRRAIIEADLVDCMVALPGQLFYSTQIPVCLWFLARDKRNNRFRDRRGETLFIDARQLGRMIDRTHRELTDEDIQRITDTYHAWRGDRDARSYEDVAGFCKAARIKEIAKHGFILTPGRYVGAGDVAEEDEPFEQRMTRLSALLSQQMLQAQQLHGRIASNLSALGFRMELER
jgi:type I restriction enzyme M protein